jgi:hypothetical protein
MKSTPMKPNARQEQGEMRGRSIRGRTQMPGQNPKQNDSPSHDQNNDENRINPLDNRQPN